MIFSVLRAKFHLSVVVVAGQAKHLGDFVIDE